MRKSILLSAVAIAAMCSNGAWAQDVTASSSPATAPSETAEQSGALQEIVVTAQKRSENLQNVPISVLAVTSSSLDRAGVKGLEGLAVAVPGLNVTNTYGRLTMSLRGIGSTSVNPGFENPIALYIDGVYYASSAGSLLSLNNINQIEVLKGPQGTLFGRNATGGLVNVTTREPTQTPAGQFSVTYGNYETVIGSAYISGGLTENLAADLAIYAKHQGEGWGKQLSTGKDVYDVDHDISVRSKLVFTPNDGTKLTLIGDYTNVKDSMLGSNLRANSVSPFLPGIQPDTGYNVRADLLPVHSIKAGGVSLRWDQEIGAIKLASITAYRRTETSSTGDEDEIEQSQAHLHIPATEQQFSQEFQVSSDAGDRFKWTAGVFYFDAKAGYHDALQALDYANFYIDIRSSRVKYWSLAGYAQGTYALDGDTNITLGGRYTHEVHTPYDTFIGFTDPVTPAVLFPVTGPAAKDNAATWRASIDHRFSPEIMVYASYNRGFKAGGYSVSNPGSPAFKPEKLDAFEAGVKTDLFDRHARLNVSGFFYKYRDVHVLRYDLVGPTTVNGAKAESYGIDADLTANLYEGLQLTAGLTWAHPTFTSYPNCVRAAPNGGVPLFPGDCSGLDLPIAPRLTMNGGLNYAFEFGGGGKLDFSGNAYYNSGFFTDLSNSIRQEKYVKLGAQIRWSDSSDRFSLTAYGTNLTNQRVLVYGESQTVGTMIVQYAEPRTYGITLGFKY